MAKKAKAPTCSKCGVLARVTTGAEIYPHRPDLHAKWFWRCDRCRGYVGCHGSTMEPMGTPADAQLRNARSTLHDRMLDPIWRDSVQTGGYTPEDDKAAHKIRACARGRVYAYLAHNLGIERKNCHTGMFDLDTCRRAWVILKGKSYAEIRDWYKARSAQGENGDGLGQKNRTSRPGGEVGAGAG